MHTRRLTSSTIHAFLASAVLGLAALGASAATPAPAEGNAPKPVPGDIAPAFKLTDQHGKVHQLADYRGRWVVVYFYPKDQTPGCTNQACQFTENVFAFRRAGAQILGISVDDETSHKAFEAALSKNEKISAANRKDIEEHGLPFPLLADPSFDTAKRYGVLAKFGPMTIATRDTFLIDPTGKVAKHYDVTPDKLDGHSAAVLADIEALKAGKKS
jgi:thioredoxin-dependent peroxiredoxin